ncbi:hypothetical protein [Acidithiobacillus ferriphilus]|jgi:hypothetical protein|uniref:hypothetical protein n=1 Tax=Acidithiobacillus ferriphilus TaxID=1689834 RepID=UPI0038CC0F59
MTTGIAAVLIAYLDCKTVAADLRVIYVLFALQNISQKWDHADPGLESRPKPLYHPVR